MGSHDERKKLEKLQQEAKHFFERSLSYLKTASGKLDQKMEIVRVRTEMIGLRRARKAALQDLGLSVYALVKVQGQVSEAEIALSVGRVRDVEETLAAKQARIDQLEVESPPKGEAAATTTEAESRAAPAARAKPSKTPSRRPGQTRPAVPPARPSARKKAAKKAAKSQATATKPKKAKATPKKTAKKKGGARRTAQAVAKRTGATKPRPRKGSR